MKFFKRTLVSFLIIISMLFASSCELLQDAIDDAVWEYSENGEAEINLNFDAIKGENFKGIFEWDIELAENGKDIKEINYKYYADKSQIPNKEKFIYTTAEETLTVLKVEEKDYYINEIEKTVSSTYISEFGSVTSFFMFVNTLGIINLDDEEMPWTFVEQNENVTISNIEGEDEEVIEYVYSKTNGEYRYQVFIGFKKVITPVLARLYYDIYKNEEKTGTLTMFLPLHTEEVKETDFEIPDAEDGYTVIE